MIWLLYLFRFYPTVSLHRNVKLNCPTPHPLRQEMMAQPLGKMANRPTSPLVQKLSYRLMYGGPRLKKTMKPLRRLFAVHVRCIRGTRLAIRHQTSVMLGKKRRYKRIMLLRKKNERKGCHLKTMEMKIWQNQ